MKERGPTHLTQFGSRCSYTRRFISSCL